ncbi:MAG: hypothetical protein ACSHX9_00270 [Luteolibacter sp.]
MPRPREEIIERYMRSNELKAFSEACRHVQTHDMQTATDELKKLLDELPEIYSDVRSIMRQRLRALQHKPITRAQTEIISTLITFYEDFKRAYKALEELPQPKSDKITNPPPELFKAGVTLNLEECVDFLCNTLNAMSQEVSDDQWSLVELNLSEKDSLAFRSLPVFFDDVWDELFEDEERVIDMEDWGEFSAREFMGTWLLISETLALRERSNANEYTQTLIKMGWSSSTLQSFFWSLDSYHRAQDGPNATHRRLIEATVNRLNLRGAIDTDLNNRWEKTFFLQFGLSRNQWISVFENQNYDIAGEYAPSIARDLLMADSIWHSSSFQETWESMQRYKKRLVGRNEAKEFMTTSSWIANEWIDDLLNTQQA